MCMCKMLLCHAISIAVCAHIARTNSQLFQQLWHAVKRSTTFWLATARHIVQLPLYNAVNNCTASWQHLTHLGC
jgi:hypothetical protein